MNPDEIVRLVDVIHRDKNIDRELIFSAIEQALLLAAKKHFDDENLDISIKIDRETGEVEAVKEGQVIDPATLGRISAQAAKQYIIQKIREAEADAIYNEYAERIGDLEIGTVQRIEQSSALVNLGKTEAILPKSEMIPGETHHVGQRVKAIILEVKKIGQRTRIVLSRSHPDFVRRLFEQEIPEIQDRTIDIRAVAREAGYRTKIAVSSIDLKVDAVGACVGVRGSRIKNIVDELNGERIDIVRFNESLQVMIPNALQPAEIEEVFLYPRLRRAIVLVREDQLSLAIGRRGQNVRLASKLVEWDIEIMTVEEYTESIDRAKESFLQIQGMTDEMAEALITEGFLSCEDLTFLSPEELAEVIGTTVDQAEDMIAEAEELAEQAEALRQEQKRLAAESQASAEAKAGEAPREQPESLLGAAPAAPPEPQHTFQSIFGEEPEDTRREEKIDPHKLFGMEPPASSSTSRPSDD
jgi:N utilization substance protein A